MCGELPSQEQTTCSGNSRCSSVCLLARPSLSDAVWNKRGQPETPARRSSRVISVRRFEFFQPIVVFAAARYCGAATTYSLLSPKSREPRNTLEYTEVRHNGGRIYFRVFGVFCGQKTDEDVKPPPSGDRWLRRQVATSTISFQPVH